MHALHAGDLVRTHNAIIELCRPVARGVRGVRSNPPSQAVEGAALKLVWLNVNDIHSQSTHSVALLLLLLLDEWLLM